MRNNMLTFFEGVSGVSMSRIYTIEISRFRAWSLEDLYCRRMVEYGWQTLWDGPLHCQHFQSILFIQCESVIGSKGGHPLPVLWLNGWISMLKGTLQMGINSNMLLEEEFVNWIVPLRIGYVQWIPSATFLSVFSQLVCKRIVELYGWP